MASQPNPAADPNWVCPLDPQHCVSLTEVLRRCADLDCYLGKLKDLGLDVSQWQGESAALQHLASGLKAIHFPHSP
jgi:hypothetical protein